MAFAVEPYILVDIFFVVIFHIETWPFRITRRCAIRCLRLVYIPITDWLGVCDISLRGLSVLLIRVIGSQDLDMG